MSKKSLPWKRALRSVLLVLLLSSAGMAKGQYQGYFEEDGLYYGILMDNPTCVAVVPPGYYGGNEYDFVNLTLTNPVVHEHDDGYGMQHDVYTLVSIGDLAFSGCNSLVSIEIPNSVTSIGSAAFYECTNLTFVDIPNSVSFIGGEAFYNCTSLASIEIPNSLTSIEQGTFYGCSSLTGSLTIPNSVTTIGDHAFEGCSGFTGDLTIGNSVTTIGVEAFYRCTGFRGSLTIGNSVTTIGERAFSGYEGTNDEGEYVAGYMRFTGELVIPNSVTWIGNEAFKMCNGFTGGLTISNSVTTISYGTFSMCSGFTGNLTIPNSVTTIEAGAFSLCYGFSDTLRISHSVRSIGSAFYGCRSFKAIIVESGNIVYDSRDSCNAIIKSSTNELIIGCKNTTIPNSVTAIGYDAFNGCSGFKGSLTIPNSVITIGDYAFGYCSGLTGLTIPNSVTTIGRAAFIGCTHLTSITLGNSVTSIGNSAFNYCSILDTITMLGTTPPSLGTNVFSISNPSFTIYVPYESLNAYKTANNWSNYEPYIKPIHSSSVIVGYGSSTTNDNWHFVSSPVAESVEPSRVFNMLSEESGYDLYQFDQSAEHEEWRNYKVDSFNIVNGRGYLYANAVDVNLLFGGDFNEDETMMVSLDYDADKPFAGWNLVGNPFPVEAYIDRSYYVMNSAGSGIFPIAVSASTPIPVCTGVMVKAESAGESVVFNRMVPTDKVNLGKLQIALTEADDSRGSATTLDKAIVSFNQGDALEKYVFNARNAQLYIPQEGKDYAIACVENESEKPLNFKATKNGEYTLTINPEAVELDYLHLIDNMTGADIDLLVSPTYTFDAKTSDYASRFRLVFSANGYADGDDEAFAFINNGDIVFKGMGGEAFNTSLQIVDVQGRVIVFRDAVPASLSTAGMVPGVYVLRLVNGDDVRTQKLVVR